MIPDKSMDQWDTLIKTCCDLMGWEKKTGFSWLLIKAQVWKESSGDPGAVSFCGARGLMQLMPGAAKDMGFAFKEMFNPQKNLMAGIAYMLWLWGRLSKIPDPAERIKFVLASYNSGGGTTNKAIRHEIADHGEAGGSWQQWCNVVDELPEIQSPGNAKQTTEYVSKIIAKHEEYTI